LIDLKSWGYLYMYWIWK